MTLADPTPNKDLPSAGDLVRSFRSDAGGAKRAFGQNFLTDPRILERIVEVAEIGPDDTALEIGCGPGTLTRTLLAAGHHVVGVELDRRAVAFLQDNLPHPALELHSADACKLVLGDLTHATSIVALGNLPYNAATEIFFNLDVQPHIRRMALMFQREVAVRFVAPEGGKTYGPLAILSTIRWRPTLALRLSPGAFWPRPKVQSAVVRFDRRAEPRIDSTEEPVFRTLVRRAFQQRRKTLRNSVASMLSLEAIQRAKVDPGARAEVLSFDDFARLARQVSA